MRVSRAGKQKDVERPTDGNGKEKTDEQTKMSVTVRVTGRKGCDSDRALSLIQGLPLQRSPLGTAG